MNESIKVAMVLAAGFGKRLRPITNTLPKPLVRVGGRSLLDRTLDVLVADGINKVVVNVHYLADQIEEHCKARTDIDCIISDERDEILETGGGTVKALPLLGEAPFLLLNADTFWVDFGQPTLTRMRQAFDPKTDDIMLLLCRSDTATGHSGGSDFLLDGSGKLTRIQKDDPHGFIYAGAAIYNPKVFHYAETKPHSLNIYFDKAISEGRLRGVILEDGHWFTVGTPEGLRQAEEKLAQIANC